MRNERVRELLDGDLAQVADLNDWGVNTVRDYAHTKGWNAQEMRKMLLEEKARIDSGSLSLVDYLHCRRTGSRFCLIRSVRRAVWSVVATRKALNSWKGGKS